MSPERYHMPFDSSSSFSQRDNDDRDFGKELSSLSLDDLKGRYSALKEELGDAKEEVRLRMTIGDLEGAKTKARTVKQRELVKEMVAVKDVLGNRELEAKLKEEQAEENTAEWANMRTENMNMETRRQREAQRPFAEKITEDEKRMRDLQIARRKAEERSSVASQIANRSALKESVEMPGGREKIREKELRDRESRLVAQLAEVKWYEFGKKSGLQKALTTTRESLAPFEQAKQQIVRAKQQKARQIIGETLSTISPSIANQPIERKQGGSSSWREFIAKYTPFLPQYDVENRGRGGLMKKPPQSRDERTMRTELQEDARNRRTGT